jgi:hypothetical protein
MAGRSLDLRAATSPWAETMPLALVEPLLPRIRWRRAQRP